MSQIPVTRQTPDLSNLDLLTVYQMIRETRDDVVKEIRAQSNNTANLTRVLLEVKGLVEGLTKDLVDTRVQRLELEIQQEEQEVERLLKIVKELEANVELKKNAKAGAINTTDRMKALSAEAVADYQEQQRTASLTTWQKRKEAVVTALLVSGALAGMSAVIALIVFLIQQYMLTQGVITP